MSASEEPVYWNFSAMLSPDFCTGVLLFTDNRVFKNFDQILRKLLPMGYGVAISFVLALPTKSIDFRRRIISFGLVCTGFVRKSKKAKRQKKKNGK